MGPQLSQLTAPWRQIRVMTNKGKLDPRLLNCTPKVNLAKNERQTGGLTSVWHESVTCALPYIALFADCQVFRPQYNVVTIFLLLSLMISWGRTYNKGIFENNQLKLS